jgi:hypothetical protein
MWSEKLFVCLLVARGFGEVKAHESDEGVDVLDCHGLHVAELRNRGVDRGDVERVCCLLVLNSVTFTPQWIR